MSPRYSSLGTLIAVALLLILCSCSGQPSELPQSSPAPAASSPADVSAELPPFPAGHSAAGLTEYVLSGISSIERSANTSESGPALLLSGAEGSFAWAIYEFTPQDESLDSLNAAFDAGDGARVWIALADYSSGRWDFSAALEKPETIAVDTARHVSPGGSLYAALLAEGGSTTTVSALSIRTIRPDNEPPTAQLTAAPFGGTLPLTVVFDASGSSDSDGQIREYAWDLDGDGMWESFSEQPFAAHTFHESGSFAVRVRVLDEQLARSGAAVANISVNAPPQAQLTVNEQSFDEGELLHFDASGSIDPDDALLNHEWDLDGDGDFSEAGAELDAIGDEALFHSIEGESGPHVVSLRVMDGAGAVDEASVVVIKRGWRRELVDDGIQTGLYCSLINLYGRPAIAYYDSFFGRLRFATRVSEGSDGWSLLTVEEGQVGSECSLALIGGIPAISYYDGLAQTLNYAWNDEPDASGQWNNIAPLAENEVGQNTSLAEINGAPAIAYTADSMNQLRYAWSSEPDATGTWQSLLVDIEPNKGRYCWLADINGRPAIAHHEFDSSDLLYSWSTEEDGSGGWTTIVVADQGNAGIRPRLELVNGFPAISYYNSGASSLNYASSGAADGSSNWSTQQIATSSGALSALAVLDGRPVVSHSQGGRLMLLRSVQEDGGGLWQSELVDDAPDSGFMSSFAVVDGRACIAHCSLLGGLSLMTLYE